MENQSAQQFKKAVAQLHFIKLLLSLQNGSASSGCFSCLQKGKRKIDFNITLCMDEEFYQLCLDLALQNMIAQGEQQEGDNLHE